MADLEGAREALKQATVVDPDWPTPCVTLALLELKTGRVAEAAVVSEHAIGIAPDLVEARYYNGLANTHLGNLEKARTSLDFVLKSPAAEQYPRTHYLLGEISMQSGELKAAALHFRQYLQLEPESKVADVVRKQLDQWEADGLI
jgi:Tfp pilus assembly protein PilF